MTYDKCIEQIDRYLKSGSREPIIVDVATQETHKRIIEKYNVPANHIVYPHDIATDDECLKDYDVKRRIKNAEGNNFFVGISLFFSLYGSGKVERLLSECLGIQTKGKVVIITYHCQLVLRELLRDPRLKENHRVLLVDEPAAALPAVILIPTTMTVKEHCLQGINHIAEVLSYPSDRPVLIVTKQKLTDFSPSLLSMRECNSSYELLSWHYPEIAKLTSAAGTAEQWDKLYEEITAYPSFDSYLAASLNSPSDYAEKMLQYDKLTAYRRWLLYLALRSNGAKSNVYLSEVVAQAHTYDSFVRLIFTHILSYKAGNDTFWRRYDERKSLLDALDDNSKTALIDFCKVVYGKDDKALYYLTDLTAEERETTIKLLAQYGTNYTRPSLTAILSHTYPALYHYLQPISTGVDNIDNYINEYTLCKVRNSISKELREMMLQEAQARSVLYLHTRSEYVDILVKDPHTTTVYFVDALGIEYLSFVLARCKARALTARVTIARCNLPSITAVNKEFVTAFEDKGVMVKSEKDLDSTKHEGQKDFNYETTKTPIHLCRELEIIDEVIGTIASTLTDGHTAYILSDHGATRMAVINEKEVQYETSGDTAHSGRCCVKGLPAEKPTCAIEENGYWCIATYDRFHGGRRAAVETHGGATIEEMVVPIITITTKGKDVHCDVLEVKTTAKEVTIKLYIDIKDSRHIAIMLNNKRYDAKYNTNFHYTVTIAEKVKTGPHTIDIYDGNNLIATGLPIEITKASKENRYF